MPNNQDKNYSMTQNNELSILISKHKNSQQNNINKFLIYDKFLAINNTNILNNQKNNLFNLIIEDNLKKLYSA